MELQEGFTFDCLLVLSHFVESHPLPEVRLHPRRPQLDRSIRLFDSLTMLAEGAIRGGSVGVEHSPLTIRQGGQQQSLRVHIEGFLVFLLLVECIAFFF